MTILSPKNLEMEPPVIADKDANILYPAPLHAAVAPTTLRPGGFINAAESDVRS